MPTTLPAATDYTGAAVTQGGKKTFMTSVRAFLADLLGTDSTMATAHAAFKNYDAGTLRNLGLAASVAASALTIAIKTAAGSDPATMDPVMVGFRSATLTSGVANLRSVTAAQSIVIASTATMGQSNGVAARLWLALIDNAGTPELAVINTQLGSGKIHPIHESGVITTLALGTGSDSAGVWYSTSARSNVPFRLIGYIESTQATAGTWATAPSVIQPMGPGVRKPGDVIQDVVTVSATVTTGSTALPIDDTTPQNTEGDEFMSQAITPASAINTLDIALAAHLATTAVATSIGVALFQDSAADAIAASIETPGAAGYVIRLELEHQQQAGSTSAQTFKVRAGSGSGTATFNGTGGVQRFNGKLTSRIRIREIMA